MKLPKHHAEKISGLSDFELDFAIREMTGAIIDDPSDPGEVVYYAEMVREQRVRQHVAKARIGEYFRQQALHEAQQSWRKNAPVPKDVIDSIHADQYANRVSLRYSDIEALAPWAERDTKAAFEKEQERRLAAVLEANPRLSEKQRETLEQICNKHHRVSTNLKSGTSYGALDGRVVNGLIKRGLLESKSYGGSFDRQGMLIIADIAAK